MTKLYEIEVPAFVLKLTPAEVDDLNRYWIRRNGNNLDYILKSEKGGTIQVIEMLLSEGIKNLK